MKKTKKNESVDIFDIQSTYLFY